MDTERDKEIQLRIAMGERLREFREAQQYSQEEMAELLGYASARYYGKVERGTATLTMKRMYRLFEKTGMDLTYLITGHRQVTYNLDLVLADCKSEKREQFRKVVEAALELAKK